MRHTLLVTDKQELEADRFAIHLLLTDELLQAHIHYTLDQWASLFGLPRKLYNYGLRGIMNYKYRHRERYKGVDIDIKANSSKTFIEK